MTDDFLERYIDRQREWSHRTFGAGMRTEGICQHIAKELDEIRAQPYDVTEWLDVVILALDGYWRAGGDVKELAWRLREKQDINLARRWPPPQPEDHATEHLR